MSHWVKSWMVTSSTGIRKYKVSYGDDHSWGCSCPVWKFRREECRHIKEIIAQVGRMPSISESPYQKPMYVLCDSTSVPMYDEQTNELRIPKGYPKTQDAQERFEVNVCSIMIDNGFSIREVRSIRGLDASWTTKEIERKFKLYGEFDPQDWKPCKNRKQKKGNALVRELILLD